MREEFGFFVEFTSTPEIPAVPAGLQRMPVIVALQFHSNLKAFHSRPGTKAKTSKQSE